MATKPSLKVVAGSEAGDPLAQERDRQARAAAADAASETAAEVAAETAGRSGAPGVHTAAGKKAAKTAKEKAATALPVALRWHEFHLDVWITDFNRIEFGFFKRSRNRAKSRQFTTDMDIIAEVIEDGKSTGLLGYRKELWKARSGLEKRLVFKLFSDSLVWHATMDMMLARSLSQTVGARGLPVTSFSINTNDDDYIIYLDRSANKWPFQPENFGFMLLDDAGKPEFFRFRRRLVTVTGDYGLYDARGREIGMLDGTLLSIGGSWRGRVAASHGNAKKLLAVMKLFCGVIIFNRQAKAHVRSTYAAMRDGRLQPSLDRQEADLYLNPRRVR
jgi:hypothetical protein